MTISASLLAGSTFARTLTVAMPNYPLPPAGKFWLQFVLASGDPPVLSFSTDDGSIGVNAYDSVGQTVSLFLLAAAQDTLLIAAGAYLGNLVYADGAGAEQAGDAIELTVTAPLSLPTLSPAPAYSDIAAWEPLTDIAGASPATELQLLPRGLPGPVGPAPWGPLAPWGPYMQYGAAAPASAVTAASSSYYCVVAHTSGAAFDPTKWQEITPGAGAAVLAALAAEGVAVAAAASAVSAAASAATSDTDAIAQAAIATTQAGIATTQAGVATSASSATTTSETAAAGSATAAAGSATAAAASAASIAGGPVASVNGLTGVVAGVEVSANKGVANGYAGLDSGGHVPTAQLPTSLAGALDYQGAWNASTNSPTLVSSTGTKGFYYKVSAAGTTSIDGNAVWSVGDLIAFDGATWDKFEGPAEAVLSVAGRSGAVTLAVADVSGAAPLASPAFTGTPLLTTTPAALDSSTKLANTGFVTPAIAAAVAPLAPLASPALTGNPTAPTQATSDNSTKIATTAMVKAAIAASTSAVSPSTQSQPTRVAGTVYQNTTTKPIYVNVTCSVSASTTVTVKSDSSATPTTIVAYAYGTVSTTVSFIVLPSNYYVATATGVASISNWTEWN